MTNPYQLEELSIELSAACMCRCIMCSSGSTPKPLPNELDPVDIESIIWQARKMGASILSFSGGDPLLQYEIVPQYVRLAIHLGYERILFYTTGVADSYNGHGDIHCNGDYALAYGGDALGILMSSVSHLDNIKERLVFVFSLHSHSAHVHNYIMGLSSYGVTVSSIRNVVNAGYKVWIHMVPMLPNWDHALPLHRLCAELGVEKMSLLRYVPQTRGRENCRRLALTVDEFAETQEIAIKMCELPKPVVRFGCPIDFRHTVDPTMKDKGHPCHAGTDLMLVRPQGGVHPCAAWKTLPDDANVRTSTLQEIWDNNHVFQAIRAFRETGWMDLGGPCSMCSYLGSCKGGCPAQKLHQMSMSGLDVSMSGLLYPIADPMCPLNGCGQDMF